MTKYLSKTPFSSGANSKAYRDNYERTFGRKTEEADSEPVDEGCPIEDHQFCPKCGFWGCVFCDNCNCEDE